MSIDPVLHAAAQREQATRSTPNIELTLGTPI